MISKIYPSVLQLNKSITSDTEAAFFFLKATCLKSFVRSQLEYAPTVWDPSSKSNISEVETVQRRAARFVTGDYRRTSTLLQHLRWVELQTLRQHAKATMVYRIVHQLVENQQCHTSTTPVPKPEGMLADFWSFEKGTI